MMLSWILWVAGPFLVAGVPDLSDSNSTADSVALRTLASQGSNWRVGLLECWGRPYAAGCDGMTQPPHIPTDIVAVGAGRCHTCVLDSHGSVTCWSAFPVPGDLQPAKLLTVARYHACIMDFNGAVDCWDKDGRMSVPASVQPAKALDAGQNYQTCSIAAADGSVQCWGVPFLDPPSGLPPASAITVALTHACVILEADGAVRCWASENTYVPDVLEPSGLPPAVAIDSSTTNTCIVTQAGELRCWGRSITAYDLTPPSDLGPVEALFHGNVEVCVRLVGGAMRCWGLGAGATVYAEMGPAEQLALGHSVACALYPITSTASSSTVTTSSTTSRSRTAGSSSTTSRSSSVSSSSTVSSSIGSLNPGSPTMSSTGSISSTSSIAVSSIPNFLGGHYESSSLSGTLGGLSGSSSGMMSSWDSFSTSEAASSSSFGMASSWSNSANSEAATSSSFGMVSSWSSSANSEAASSSPWMESSETSSASPALPGTAATAGMTTTVARPTPEEAVTIASSSTLPPATSALYDTAASASTTTTVARPAPEQGVATTPDEDYYRQLAEEVEAAIVQGATAAAVELQQGNGTVVATRFGSLTLLPVARLQEASSVDPALWRLAAGGEGAGVLLAKSLLWSLPSGSFLAMLALSRSPASDPFAGIGVRLATPSVAITILSSESKRVRALPEPLRFRLPAGEGSLERRARCAFLELSKIRVAWSGEGVRRVQEEEGVWCETEHLSIFTAVVDAALGCTNLELFTPRAIRAVRAHEGWWRARPVVLWISATAVLLACLALGALREAWALRLGRSHEDGKAVSICQALPGCGPQLLKHRYAAFLVFARDIIHCLRTGRARLRVPTLTAGVQRCIAVRTGVSTACVAQHCWNGGAWLHSAASLPHTVLCHKLEYHAAGAEWVVEQEFSGRRVLDVGRRFAITFLALHPLLDAMRLGASSMSVWKRMSMQIGTFMGVLATNAMIFEYSGTQRGWEADAQCPVAASSELFIIVATMASVTLNVLPNTFLADVARQVHGRPGWNAVFWLLCLAYLGGTSFLSVVALANFSDLDQQQWHSTIEWTMIIKFMGMPAAQALRHEIMLEHYIREEPGEQHIMTSLGLRDPHEEPLEGSQQEAVALLAKRTISAGELLSFLSLLGDVVMPDFCPKTSTSKDVATRAIRLFQQPQAEAFLELEVAEAQGLRLPAGQRPPSLRCSVTHLGRLCDGRRPVLGVAASQACRAGSDGSCGWQFRTQLRAVGPEHTLEFAVWAGDCIVARANWPMGELLLDGRLRWALALQAEEGEGAVTGSGGAACKGVRVSRQATLVVEVGKEARRGLARRELRRLASRPPVDESEAEQGHVEASLLEGSVEEGQSWAAEGYCEAKEEMPAERLVVHCLEANFLDLAAALLAEALGERPATVRKMLEVHDFTGLLEALRRCGRLGRRYWLDIFAMEVGQVEAWHEDLLRAQPWLLRALQQGCCRRMAKDLRAGQEPCCGLPTQLFIMDQGLHLLRDGNCLAAAVLGKSLGLAQELLLHPEHLRSSRIGSGLKELPGTAIEDVPWTEPYIRDRAALYLLLANLAVAAAEKQMDEAKASLEDLNLHDVAASVAGMVATRPTTPGVDMGRERTSRVGDVGGEDTTMDADVAVD